MVSEETAHLIDEEIRSVIDRNYERSERLITEHMKELKVMAEALIKYETIDRFQIDDIMEGKTPRPPQSWDEAPPSGGSSASSGETAAPSEDVGKAAEQH